MADHRHESGCMYGQADGPDDVCKDCDCSDEYKELIRENELLKSAIHELVQKITSLTMTFEDIEERQLAMRYLMGAFVIIELALLIILLKG